jgi:Fungal chitosanase of glycosyl hydrolase group 75
LFEAEVGDFGFVVNSLNGKSCGCIFADTDPGDVIGEGSIALAIALGINADPKKGGINDGLGYIVFPGTKCGWPLSADEIRQKATKLFDNWGGLTIIKTGLPKIDWK